MFDERPVLERTREASSPAPNELVVRVEQDRRRRRPSAVLGLLTAAALAAVVLGGFALASGWFGVGDLFAPRTTDRSAPVLVEKLRNLSEFHGASGTFSTTVDLEHTIGVIPRFVAGDRAVYSGVGTVDASVDLRGLATPTTRSADGALVVRLPHARLGAVTLDSAKSHVMNRDRGFLDRIGGVFVDSPTSDHALEQASRRRIAAAAAAGPLRHKAEASTARMIERLARATGAGPVEVRFAAH